MEFSSQLFTAPAIKSNKISSSSFTGRGAGISAPKLNVSNISRVVFNTKPKDIERIEAITNVVEEKPKIVEKIFNVVEEKPKIVEKIFNAVEEKPKIVEKISTEVIKVPKGMGYGSIHSGPNVDPKYLRKEKTPFEQTLVETNKILVEIQEQLLLDYSSRIAKEKKEIANIRKAESKRKFSAKEKSVEAVKKISGGITGTISKVAAPVKGIFDRIKEFFGLILTGIITNVAFTWLADKKNQKLLGDIFNFIGTTIPYLVVGLLGYKIFKWGRRLFRIGRFLWRLPGRILRLFGLRSAASTSAGAGADTARRGGGFFRNTAGQRRGLTVGREIQSRVVPGRFNVAGGAIKENVEVITRQKNLFNKTLQGLEVKGKMFGRNFLKVLGAGPGKKTLVKSLLKFARPILKRIPIVGALIDFALSVAMGENIGRAAFGAIGAALLGAIGTFLGGPIGTFIGGLAGDWAGRQLYDLFFGNSSSKDVAEQQQKDATKSGKVDPDSVDPAKFNRGGTVPGSPILASNGMTVPGRGSGNVDTVSARLAPGEEVIRTSSAMLYRPLLKDINDNAGRLWAGFEMGVNKIMMVSKYQEDVQKEFAATLEDHDNYLRNLKTEKISSGGGGIGRGGSAFRLTGRGGFSSKDVTSKQPKIASVNMTPPSSSGGGMIFLPMMMPPQRSKPPQIPQMQSPATGVESVPSSNVANPWMLFVPELYGIMI